MEITNKDIGALELIERLGETKNALNKEQRDYSKLNKEYNDLEGFHESQTKQYNTLIVENAELKKVMQLKDDNLAEAMLHLKNEIEKRKATENAIQLLDEIHQKTKKEKSNLQRKYNRLLKKQ